jgi:hypothetical protein
MKRILLFSMLGSILASGFGVASTTGPFISTQPPSFVPAGSPHVAPADTVRRRVAAGEPLIMTLPGALSDRPVAAYRLLQAPALSWLVGRSFFWRTRPEDAGTHVLLVRAAFDQPPPDTLTILVDVTP